MTIQWTGFPSAVDATVSDILVGLAGGTANARFNVSSLLLKANNLSDLASASTARTNLGLGTAAVQANSFFLQSANNLSDLGSSSTARTNLGLGTAATHAIAFFLQSANNLSDLASLSTALTNLGLNTTNDVTFNSVTATVSQTAPSFISTALDIYSHANALTAHVGGGQGSALALSKAINRVTTVASAGDSVKLPAGLAGESVVVVNAAASNAMDCFPASGESINALSANTALSIVANTTVIFFCAVNGVWNSVVTA
jgi:hypothetical protein